MIYRTSTDFSDRKYKIIGADVKSRLYVNERVHSLITSLLLDHLFDFKLILVQLTHLLWDLLIRLLFELHYFEI